MNKTIIININGIIFHIEEDAYEVLKNYMTDVKRHFANSEDSLEITTDIENRIAEMFNEMLLRENRQVIVTADVNNIIAQMGTAADFETSAADENAGADFASHQAFTDNRKLFRDPDDHLIGGVCAGIANYFDVETVWIRIAFALAFCFGGTGLMLYIILWIVVPKALSRADRMAMKGEKLDLQGFARNFEEELKNVHSTFKAAGREAKPFVYKARDFTGDFFHHFKVFLISAARVLLKMLGVLILLICFGFFIAALVGFIALMAYSRDIYSIFPFIDVSFANDGFRSIIYFSAFILVAIPLVVIVMATLSGIFNSQGINRSAGYTLLVVWLGSLSILIYSGARVSRQFRVPQSFTQTIKLKPTKNNVYHLKLNDVMFLTKEDSMRMDINHDFDGHIIINDDDDIRSSMREDVQISIEKSDVNQIILEETFSAQGVDERNALRNARAATYHFVQQDSLLIFDKKLRLANSAKWRKQRIHITLKVPNDAVLFVDESINPYISNNMDIDECRKKNKHPLLTSAPFIMTDSGLNCKVDTTAYLFKQPIAK
jgi:phage shock protein PspC (stress-responsive transcriptional regulator)